MKEAQKPPGKPLSEREAEIVQLAAQGKSDKEIAAALDISIGTLGTYWARIRAKRGMRWRTEIVAQFVREQIASEPVVGLDGPVLDAIGYSITILDRDGQVLAGNAAYAECLAELGIAGPIEGPLDPYLAFDNETGLAERLRAEGRFSCVVSIMLGGVTVKRSFLRVWPMNGSAGRWVAMWEFLPERAAIEVEAAGGSAE